MAALLVGLGLIALAGCTDGGGEPTATASPTTVPPSTPTTSPTPTPTAEDEAAAAAEEVVRAYYRAQTECLTDAAAVDATCFDDVAIGSELTELRNTLGGAQAMRTTVTGTIDVVSVDLLSVSLDMDVEASPPVVPEVGFEVCYDAARYDVLDEGGKSIVPADRIDRQILELHVLNYGYPDQGQWRVGFIITPDPARPC
jgi:hypothetical protein